MCERVRSHLMSIEQMRFDLLEICDWFSFFIHFNAKRHRMRQMRFKIKSMLIMAYITTSYLLLNTTWREKDFSSAQLIFCASDNIAQKITENVYSD